MLVFTIALLSTIIGGFQTVYTLFVMYYPCHPRCGAGGDGGEAQSGEDPPTKTVKFVWHPVPQTCSVAWLLRKIRMKATGTTEDQIEKKTTKRTSTPWSFADGWHWLKRTFTCNLPCTEAGKAAREVQKAESAVATAAKRVERAKAKEAANVSYDPKGKNDPELKDAVTDALAAQPALEAKLKDALAAQVALRTQQRTPSSSICSITVKSAMHGDAEIYMNGSSTNTAKNGLGFNVVTINPRTRLKETSAVFDTNGAKKRHKKAATALVQFINGIPQGHMVVVAVKGGAAMRMTDNVCNALQTIGGTGKKTATCLIGRKGDPKGDAKEGHANEHTVYSADGGPCYAPGQEPAKLDFDFVTEICATSAGNEAIIYMNGSSTNVAKNARGFNIVTINASTRVIKKSEVFDTQEDENAATALVQFISNIPKGHVVVVAVKDDASKHMTDRVCNALQTIGGTGTKLGSRQSFSLIGRKGDAKGKGKEKIAVQPSDDSYFPLENGEICTIVGIPQRPVTVEYYIEPPNDINADDCEAQDEVECE